MYSHELSLRGHCWGRRETLVSLPIRTLILLDQGPNVMTTCNLNYFLRVLIQLYWGVRDSVGIWEDTIQSIAGGYI